MAGKSSTRPKTGGRSRAAKCQGAKCDLFAAGAFCARAEGAPSKKKRVAHPRDEFRYSGLCAHLKKTFQCYRERHHRGATEFTARVDPKRVVGVRRRSFERSAVSPWRFVSC